MSTGSIASAAGERCASTTSASTARDRNVLSTPHMTSPSGLPAVNAALAIIVPVSPATTISTSMPVSAVNAANASFAPVPSTGNDE